VDLALRYLVGTGLSAVAVVVDPNRQQRNARLELITDVAASAALIVTREVPIVQEFWFSNAEVATRVFQKALEWISPGDDADALTGYVSSAAGAVGARAVPGDEVSARCSAAAADVEKTTNEARLAGELTEVNRAYAEHRKAAGAGAVSYESWLHSYKVRVVEQAAARVRGVLRTSTT
jgi:hypothetical protein